MKVYCSNCKHYEYFPPMMMGGGYGECKLVTRIVDGPIKVFETTVNDGHLKKNANNDCGDYERKWWKLWV